MKWAKEEVEAFNVILARQLSSTEEDGEVWTLCMDRAKTHAKMLSEVGLDFRNLVGQKVKGTGAAAAATANGNGNGNAPVGLGLRIAD